MKKKINVLISLNDYIIYKNLPFAHRKRIISILRLNAKEIILQEKRYFDNEK